MMAENRSKGVGLPLQNFLFSLPPALLALALTLVTWAVTALGAAVVFFFARLSDRLLDLLTGFGAGVMIASSFWSLLSPALESDTSHALLLTSLGFVGGVAFVLAADRVFDLVDFEHRFGLETASRRRSLMLILAVTVHNIPEGMAIGVAVGSAALQLPGASMLGALALAAGIALQNFPEGASVSLPLRREGMSLPRCFFYGQLSGMPEPVAGVLGALLALWIGPALPFFLSFAAGAMIAVVTGEMIPASAASNKGLAVVGVTVGFLVMMVLDVTF
jgi:ZIP family zinc transporter